MATVTRSAEHRSGGELDGTRSFLVTRQDPVSRRYERVGVLTELDDGWSFRYFSQVAQDGSVRSLPGFPRLDRAAHSASLFPLFAQRVISGRRPDRSRVLSTLGLDESATAFEILAANGGRRQGDTIELIQLPVPHPGGGETLQFLVHGMRHRSADEQRAVDWLRVGDALRIVPEPQNRVDGDAYLVTTVLGDVLGWVPAPLTPLVSRATDVRARVAHANRSTENPHLRLLVELRGALFDAARFTDPRWDLVD